MHERGELYEIFSAERRSKQFKWYLSWGIVNVVLMAYIIFLVSIFWDETAWYIPCVKRMNVWLVVYLVLQCIHLVRTVMIMIIWKCARDPSVQQIKVELLLGVWVFLAEACWIIYGNTFVFDEETQTCQYSVKGSVASSTDTLYDTVLVLVIYGYFLLLGIIGVVCFGVFAFLGYKAYVKQDTELLKQQQMGLVHDKTRSSRVIEGLIQEGNAPTLMASLRRLTARGLPSPNSVRGENSYMKRKECGLCFENFKPSDEVVNCNNLHVFHTHCYEDRAVDEEEAHDSIGSLRNVCPLCDAPMNLEGTSDSRSSINDASK